MYTGRNSHQSKRRGAGAAERVLNFVRSWPVIEQTAMVVLEATRGVEQHQLHFWDAQLWASAELNQIDTILTEDLPGGTTIEGVRFVNPFAPAFENDSLL